MQYALFIGEMLIDFIPESAGPDGTVRYQPHPGGAVANAAVALARLGGRARFVGKLGQDSFGRLLLKTLHENGVDTRYIPTTDQGNTTLVLVTLQTDGQREFTFYRHQTADTLLETANLHPQMWESVAYCYAGSVLLASEPARSATLTALDQARERGISVGFDVNVRPAIWSNEAEIRAMLAQVIGRVDLLKCSAEEIHYLHSAQQVPLDPEDGPSLRKLGQHLLAQGPALVIITRGALGALLMTDKQTIEIAALTSSAVDTTGAGDAFSGALLYKLLARNLATSTQLAALSAEDLEELGTFANRTAGISCMRYGGMYSLPFLAEIDSFEKGGK